MYLFVSVFLFISMIGFVRRNSKSLALIILFFAWLLMGWNYDNADYSNYELKYKIISNPQDVFLFGSDVGYYLLFYLAKNWGLSYQDFLIIISFVGLSLLYRVIIKIGCPSFLASCYVLILLLIDTIQIRNFFGCTFLLNGILCLLSDEKRYKSIIFFFIWVLLATTIHFSFIFTFFFVFSIFNVEKKLISVLIILCVFFKFTIYDAYSDFFDTEKVNNFIGESSFLGFVFGSGVLIANAIIIEKISLYNQKNSNPTFKTMGISNVVSNINWLILIIIPFLWDNGNYNRIFRDITLLNMAFFYEYAFYYRGKIEVLFLLILTYFLYWNSSVFNYFEPIFNHNLLIQ